MIKKNEVYCKNCEYYSIGISIWCCYNKPFGGKVSIGDSNSTLIEHRNCNNDCPYFKQKELKTKKKWYQF